MQIDFSSFKTLLTDALVNYYAPKRVKISFHEIVKNNDTKLHGITIEFTDMNVGDSPILYIDNGYQCVCDGKISFDDFINTLIRARKSHDISTIGNAARSITEWEAARQILYPVLVSAERNEESLKGLVTKDFLDLKIIYVLRGVMKKDDFSCIKVTKRLFSEYDITLEALHEQAMKNLRNDQYSFCRIEDILMGATDISPVDHLESGLYCLSNGKKMYGAAGILDLEKLAEAVAGNDVYVIPSSVHEMLILPVADYVDVAELNQMIREINRSIVKPEEFLSDHAYFYNSSEKRLQIAA